MRFVAGRGAVAKRLAALRRIAIGKLQAGALWRVVIGKMLLTREPIKNIIGKNLLAKAHKNLDFVLEKPENEGLGGQKRTKTPILCSGSPKTRASEGKNAQKPRLCARNARKQGFRRPKKHKNADFVLERPENEGFGG